MLKVIGIGLLGLFALMVIPSGVADEVNPVFYGTANVILADPSGNVLMAQTVHNLITDEGETFIINQVFDTSTSALTGTSRVGAICIYEALDSAFSESTTDALSNALTSSTTACHSTASGVMTNSAQTSTTDAEVFTAGSSDFAAPGTISGILICAKDAGDGDFAACSTPSNSVALAALDINNVTVTGTDTITITYTFDITTPTS